MKIGFIGLGAMGGAVARRLAATGTEIIVYDTSDVAVERCVTAGAVGGAGWQDAVDGVQAVFTSLPTPEVVEETVARIVGVAPPGTIVVDVSTTDPTTARRVADLCDSHGLSFVAAPLGKGPAQAEEGRIPVFVGGSPEALERITPVLERMSEAIHDLGTVEAATTFKIVSNLVGMTNVAALAEGLVLARRAGIDPEVFHRALAETGAASYQESLRLPWMMQEDWQSRFAVDLAVKDLRLGLDAACRWSVPAPVSSACLAQLTAASAHGYGTEDVVALVKVLQPGFGKPNAAG